MSHTVDESGIAWEIVPPIETLVAIGDGTPFGNMTYGGGPASGFDGYVKKGINFGPFNSATPGYTGKSFASPKAISKVIVYGPADRGYANSGVAQNVTLSVYGKVGNPSSGTDGTVLGTMTFVQSITNESAPRTFVSSDQITKFTHVWARVDGGSGISTELSQIVIYEMFSTPPLAYLGYIKMAFMGDSIVSQMGGYQSVLSEPFKSAQNFGVSGASIGGAAGSPNIVSQTGSIPMGATHVVIEGGNNNLPLYESMIIPGYTAILNAIPSYMKAIIVGIPHLDEAQLNISHPGWLGPNYCNAKFDSVNASINALAASYPNAVIATAAQAMNMTGKTSDGIHFLNGNVYRDWTTLLAQCL